MASAMLQASPDFKGIKTISDSPCSFVVWLQASPDFKGIKTENQVNILLHCCFKPALISKGLRRRARRWLRKWRRLQASPDFKGIKTSSPARSAPARCFKPALISKGLRLPRSAVTPSPKLQASPDFKGIKTIAHPELGHAAMLQASPDFKGIKTGNRTHADVRDCFKPALISKGLRPAANCASMAPIWLQASPDFKGIKTDLLCERSSC